MSRPERVRLDAATMAALDRRRSIKDKITNVTIGFGGIFVVLAIALIFVYLLVESWPLFQQAKFDQAQSYQTKQQATWVDNIIKQAYVYWQRVKRNTLALKMAKPPQANIWCCLKAFLLAMYSAVVCCKV